MALMAEPLVKWLLFIAALAYTAKEAIEVLGTYNCRNWPSTTGKLKARRLNAVKESGGGPASSTRIPYTPEVRFEYQVDGRPYEGTRFCFGEFEIPTWDTEAFEREYMIGREIPVYYDPVHPERSVLNRNEGAWVFRPLVAPLVLLLCVLLVLLQS